MLMQHRPIGQHQPQQVDDKATGVGDDQRVVVVVVRLGICGHIDAQEKQDDKELQRISNISPGASAGAFAQLQV